MSIAPVTNFRDAFLTSHPPFIRSIPGFHKILRIIVLSLQPIAPNPAQFSVALLFPKSWGKILRFMIISIQWHLNYLIMTWLGYHEPCTFIDYDFISILKVNSMIEISFLFCSAVVKNVCVDEKILKFTVIKFFITSNWHIT